MGGPRPEDDFINRMLDDPLIQLLMHADKVDRDSMTTMLRKASASVSMIEITETVATSGYFPDNGDYRSGVGIMLLNSAGRVFVGRRIDQAVASWQMPQGGIDEGETPKQAALRELKEETGIDKVQILAETGGWLRYDYPADIVGFQGYKGQQQQWFAMLFLGEDAEIDVATDHPEFNDWQWATPERLPELIVAFKRQLYRDVTAAFSQVVSAATR
jgi:putative (di)nucleoside polyphosphate hydrolase